MATTTDQSWIKPSRNKQVTPTVQTSVDATTAIKAPKVKPQRATTQPVTTIAQPLAESHGTTGTGTYTPAPEQAITAAKPDAIYDSSTYSPVTQAQASEWTVDPNQTVAGQLKGLLSEDNPLVQMSKTQGLQDANARGLLNSSLGAEAGALAHYQYAMPIATQDASTYSNAAQTNANNKTQVGLSNANAENTRSNLDVNHGYNIEQSNLDFAHNKALSQMQIAAQAAQQKNAIDAQTAAAAKAQEYTLQSSYASTINNTAAQTNAYRAQIMNNPNMTAEQKNAALANIDTMQSNWVSMVNTSYSAIPNWSSSLAVNFTTSSTSSKTTATTSTTKPSLFSGLLGGIISGATQAALAAKAGS